jgi:hypothetical protein
MSKSVKDVINEMMEEYQAKVQIELENIHQCVKVSCINRARESSDAIEEYRDKIYLLSQVWERLQREANIE